MFYTVTTHLTVYPGGLTSYYLIPMMPAFHKRVTWNPLTTPSMSMKKTMHLHNCTYFLFYYLKSGLPCFTVETTTVVLT